MARIRFAEKTRSSNSVTPRHPMQQISGAAFRKRSLHPLAGITILQLVGELEASPAARAAIETAEALVAVGGTPLVAGGVGSMVSELQARGGIFVRFPVAARNPLALALGVARLVHLIRAEAIDIVHARSCLAALVALGAARVTRTPVVTSLPAYRGAQGRLAAVASSVMARGDRILAEWAFDARMAQARDPALEGRIHVTGPGVDRAAFAAEQVSPARVGALRHRWQCPPDKPIVLFSAEPNRAGALIALRATQRHLRANGFGGVRLVHIETGSGRAFALDPTAESPDALLPCDDMPAALLAASVVVFPSGESEATCRLATEAQAMGTPVVVVDEGALAETVLAPPHATDSMRTGWQIPAGEPEALAAAVAAALGLGASARDRLALRARAHVDRSHSIERMRTETLRAFIAVRGGDEH
jgi:glycosyltransferase involved in cell wall biosynthesis